MAGWIALGAFVIGVVAYGFGFKHGMDHLRVKIQLHGKEYLDREYPTRDEENVHG